MTTTLELVFQYRQLVGSCEAGAGLSFDEIEVVSAIESLFAVEVESSSPRLRWRDRPLLGTQPVHLSAVLRGKKSCDSVEVVALGPEGLICRRAPYMDEGEHFEVIIESGEHSYRFHAKVIWAEDADDGNLEVELAFTGIPVLVRYGEVATRPASQGDGKPTRTKRPALVVEPGMATAAA